jgi:hypothetical protein
VPNHQTYHNCSFSDPEEVFYLFGEIRNPRWLPWFLICRDIFSFFFRTSKVSRLAAIDSLGSSRSVVVFQSNSKSYVAVPTLFPTTASFEVTKLTINVPLGDLKKCC